MSSQIDDIKNRDLKRVLQNEYGLDFNNSNLALCPFHNDTIPSFSDNDNNGTWLFRESKNTSYLFDKERNGEAG